MMMGGVVLGIGEGFFVKAGEESASRMAGVGGPLP
jgi:hypothetical protein